MDAHEKLGLPSWNEFMVQYEGIGGHMSPVRLLPVYELLIAMAIFHKLRHDPLMPGTTREVTNVPN